MKFKNVYKLFVLIALAVLWQGRSAGPAAVAGLQVTGAPGSVGNLGTCGNSGCHTAGAFNPSLALELVDQTTNEVVTEYIPGRVYLVRFSFSADAGVAGYGFQAVILDDNDANIGAWDTDNLGSSIQVSEVGGRSYLEHKQPENETIWAGLWTAPEAGSGNFTVYAAGIASNRNGGSSGDGVAASSLTIAEQMVNSTTELDRSFATVAVTPNPVTEQANLTISSRVSGEFQLNIVSVTGKMVLSDNVNLQTGQNNKELDLSHLQSGMYFLQLIGEDRISTESLIKL